MSHEGVGWVGKEKVNARLSALGLPGASRNPRGHQPADLLALRSCVLPSTTGWVRWPCRLVNRLDTALHITVLLHGLYVGVIPIWLHWHDQAVGRHGTTRC